MKNILFTLLNLIIACSFLSSCSEGKKNIVDVSTLNSDTLINIPQWKLMSSFYLDSLYSPETVIDYNFLNKYGVSESQIHSLKDFENICTKIIRKEDNSKKYQSIDIDRDGLNIQHYAKKKNKLQCI